MIEELKSALAQNKIREFLKSMQKLGFKNEETIALMQKSLDTSKPSES